jgi:hypothetical protein
MLLDHRIKDQSKHDAARVTELAAQRDAFVASLDGLVGIAAYRRKRYYQLSGAHFHPAGCVLVHRLTKA